VHSARVIVSSNTPTLTATAALTGRLALYNDEGVRITDEGIHVEDRAFTITVPVSKHKTLPLGVSLDVPSNFRLNSLRNKINIEPKEITISEVIEAAIEPFVDAEDSLELGTVLLLNITLANLKEGLEIQIAMPNDRCTNMSEVNQALLTFDNVEDYDERVFNLPTADFTVRVPRDYRANHLTARINVRVVGPSEVLQELTADDISGTIDLRELTDLSPGINSAAVEFAIAGSNVVAWVAGEYKVDMLVTES